MTDQRPIGYWLKLVDNLIERQFATTLDEHGVTRRQWQLLNVLARSSATVEQLDDAIAPFLDGASESAVEHLSELIDSAWVDATADGYELTDRGRTAFTTLAEVVAKQRAVVAQGISEAEYAETVGVLEKMARNLGFAG
jgi:DNA-binding MarR family transcriptional regulator